MITPLDIARKTMTQEKRKNAKNDFFAYYIGRPISYVLTIPFLYAKITPNVVSVISIIPCIAGFLFMGLGGSSLLYLLIGWGCFFLWNLLDGVDGNIARYKGIYSRYGSTLDAMSGYIAMILSFFACGWAASHNQGYIAQIINVPSELYIVFGALSGIFVIFPRFIMHKMISSIDNFENADSVKNKSEYGVLKIIALNLISISGFVQVLMLLAVIFNLLDIFTIGYFILNFLVMIFSLIKLFR